MRKTNHSRHPHLVHPTLPVCFHLFHFTLHSLFTFYSILELHFLVSKIQCIGRNLQDFLDAHGCYQGGVGYEVLYAASLPCLICRCIDAVKTSCIEFSQRVKGGCGLLILPLQVRMKVMKEDDEIEEYKDDHKGEDEGKEIIRKNICTP